METRRFSFSAQTGQEASHRLPRVVSCTDHDCVKIQVSFVVTRKSRKETTTQQQQRWGCKKTKNKRKNTTFSRYCWTQVAAESQLSDICCLRWVQVDPAVQDLAEAEKLPGRCRFGALANQSKAVRPKSPSTLGWRLRSSPSPSHFSSHRSHQVPAALNVLIDWRICTVWTKVWIWIRWWREAESGDLIGRQGALDFHFLSILNPLLLLLLGSACWAKHTFLCIFIFWRWHELTVTRQFLNEERKQFWGCLATCVRGCAPLHPSDLQMEAFTFYRPLHSDDEVIWPA